MKQNSGEDLSFGLWILMAALAHVTQAPHREGQGGGDLLFSPFQHNSVRARVQGPQTPPRGMRSATLFRPRPVPPCVVHAEATRGRCESPLRQKGQRTPARTGTWRR